MTLKYRQRTYWPNGQHRVNRPLMCGQKINTRIHKTLEINYNFPSKVYKKAKVRSIDLNTDKLFSWTRAAGRRFHIKTLVCLHQ